MISSRLSKSTLVFALCFALVACKSDSERAEEYFQSGIALLEAGDVDRAMVEFRNVFEFERNHLGTRQAMAEFNMEQGNERAAYGHYVAIAEQYPENFEARRALAELAFSANNWDDFERHGTAAIEMQPDDPRVQVIDLGLNYRRAILDEDDPARQALTAPSEALLEQLPKSKILNNLLIDSYVRDGRMGAALARVDVLIADAPDDRTLYNRRLALLAQMQDTPEIETQLQQMVETFPDDNEVQSMLLRYYVSQQKLDEAEAFLREISDPSDEDPSLFLSLVQFVGQTKGEAAAREEIERAIAENPKPNRFKAMLAMLDFNGGDQEAAIADMEAILATADAADPEIQTIKTGLARMLVGTGNQVGARRLVEEVLATNPSNVEALKMQAVWQIQADETDEAISNLRIALDTAPDDIQVMNLMFDAYSRAGETDLARDYLAQAADVSGNAPEPSLRYARLLIAEERYLPAEDVLLPALRQAPRNVDLLRALGGVYLNLEDIPRATQVIDTLNRIDTDQSRSVANLLQADVLRRESGTEDALAFLENLAASGDANVRDQLMLVRAQILVGETAAALAQAEELSAANPTNLGLKQVLATAQTANGDLTEAEATYREITQAAPKQAVQSWMQLARIASRQGDPDKAVAVIDEALTATERNANVVWAKASVLERSGDIDGAIALYEELYAQNSASVIIANNLASMLATYKTDEASLERAWVVGRRLQGADNPAMQDTYGWLLFRRGEVEASVPYLENAAAQLNDPVVHAHLGFAYAALERNDEALEQMQKAVDLAGPADTRERIELARAEITRLRSLPEN